MSNLNELKAVFHFKSNERSDYADYNCHFCKNCFIRPHSHYDYYELLIVIEGEIENVLNGKKILQKVGSVSLLSPSSNHSLNCKEGSLHFNLAVKTRRFEGLIQNKNALKNALNENSYLTTTLSEEAFNYVNKLIGNINNESYDAYNCALVESVLYAVICEFYSELKVSEPQTKIAEYCVDAVNKINNYSYINMQATDVYRLYPVSHTAFIKEFKNLTGKTLVAYLQSKKLDYAKTLLLTTNYSVLEISSLLNYDSLSYFIRIFKAEYGLTPFKFRKNNVGAVFTKNS